MGHFSPIPPDGRRYAKNYRRELEPYEAQLVEVSGRCKEFRDHPDRRDLQSVLLVDLDVVTVEGREPIRVSHLWVLTKHLKRADIDPTKTQRVKFIGSVYAYFRLGGKSRQRGLHGLHDFSILPMESSAIEDFKPGLSH